MPMNLLISGTDPVAVDTVGSLLIGKDNVKHINIAAERGFGTNNLEEIDVLPSADLIDKYKVQLDHKNIPQGISEKVTIFRGKEKVCKTGCAFLDVIFM